MPSPYEGLQHFAYDALAVSSSSVGFDSSDYSQSAGSALLATVKVEGAAVRYRLDGATTAPTASVGVPLEVGEVLEVWGSRDIQNIRFIRRDGVDATLNVDYYRASMR